LQFFAIGFLFGNTRALAMEPIGHIAGIGAAINGFVSTMMAVPIATYIGGFVQTTALPLFVGFFICGSISLILIQYLKVSNKKEQALKINDNL
jgi:DHA1 family bicyclomycin/chloramphenicol resistance-like MFS transporter